MIMWGTVMDGNLVNLAHVNAETVPENHADAGIAPIPKDHVDAGTVLTLESHVDAGTILALENHVNDKTVHVHTGMLTRVQTPQRSDIPTTQLWTP